MGICGSSSNGEENLPQMPLPFPRVGEVIVFEQIAEGGYSVVFKGADGNGCSYAVKRMICVEEEQLAMAKHEIDVYKMLNRGEHKNILTLIDSYITPSRTHPHGSEVYLLFPYYPMTLHDLVNSMKTKRKVFTEEKLLALFSQICEAVLEFHTRDPPLAVRDIKAANVLLTEDESQCLLMDFGSVAAARQVVRTKNDAVLLQEEAETTISPSCRPVELFDVQVGLEIDEKTDVWSLGSLLYFMAAQEFAFDSTQGSVHLAALNGITSFPEEMDGFSSEVKDLITRMCSPPESRPTLAQAMQDLDTLRLFHNK
uniref:non-specific serine/threonine protein kinase n=1 Tax=Paramoeba aestuarina TaxID=180227 RepID=A0A7S4L0G8_9EUKA|mmetsp:Transcript_29308/g.45302  ORF Transcript_29308/g.45302 Transcript_29308/m.45302 type:complete len:312 (+) Transcript_29308:100-1035(+)